jgi:hypothetical protein
MVPSDMIHSSADLVAAASLMIIAVLILYRRRNSAKPASDITVEHRSRIPFQL